MKLYVFTWKAQKGTTYSVLQNENKTWKLQALKKTNPYIMTMQVPNFQIRIMFRFLNFNFSIRYVEIVIFYTEILERKVDLWCYFTSETSENIHNSTFRVKISVKNVFAYFYLVSLLKKRPQIKFSHQNFSVRNCY